MAENKENKTPENEDTKKNDEDLREWNKDSEFLAFLKEVKGIADITADNKTAVKEARKEYEERKKQNENDKPSQETPKEAGDKPEEASKEAESDDKTLKIGKEDKGEEKQKDNNNDKQENSTLKIWEKWADKHNYLFENTQEEDYDYSFNLYKDKDAKEANQPSASIKAKNDSLFVKSDDLEVYREIARQAKDNKYTSINLLNTLSPEQTQMMMLAALEQGLNIKGNTQKIDLNNDIFKDLNEETKNKVQAYNKKLEADEISKSINAAITEAKKYKAEHPDGVMDYPKTNNPEILAINIYAAKVAGCNVEAKEFLSLPQKAIPEEHKKGLFAALEEHNAKVYNGKKEKILEGGNDQEVDIKACGNAEDQAIAFAVCSEAGIKMTNIPDMITTDKLQYLPEAARNAVEKHNKEFQEKVRNKLQKRENKTEQKQPEQTQAPKQQIGTPQQKTSLTKEQAER